MASNINVDIPKSQAKHTKAMVYRSRQVLRKKLKNIDSEYSKSLSNIDRDLEKSRDALKALRVSQKLTRRDSGHNMYKQGMDFALSSVAPVPTPPLLRRSRASTFPFESDSSLKLVERRRPSKVTVRPQVRSRKIVGMKPDGREDEINMRHDKLNRRESQISMKKGRVSQNAEQEELEVNKKKLQAIKSELSDKTETLTTISCTSPACDSSKVDQGGLATKVAEGLETNVAEGLGTNIAVVRGDLGTKMTETTGDSQAEEVLGENVAEVQGDLGTSKLTVDQPKEPGSESDPPRKPISPGNEDDQEPVAVQETSVQEVLRNSWTNYDASKKETVNKNSLLFANKASITQEKSDISSLTSPPKQMLTRRASSPNITITTTQAEPVLNKPKTGFSGRPPSLTSTQEPTQYNTSSGPPRKRMLTRRASSPNMITTTETEAGKPSFEHKPSLTSIQELTHGNTSGVFPPSEKPAPRPRIARRSSIAVMTGVANPLVLGSPRYLVRSLPELTDQSSSAPDWDKYNLKKGGSIQENQIQESLRKISRRLTTPLTGAQLEKRLQAHRVGAAALQTRVARTPENKAPNELDMSDLQDCRYIRSRVSK